MLLSNYIIVNTRDLITIGRISNTKKHLFLHGALRLCEIEKKQTGSVQTE